MFDKLFIDGIESPPVITNFEGDIFSDAKANFAHCVSSDLPMSAGTAMQFVRTFPDLSDLQ